MPVAPVLVDEVVAAEQTVEAEEPDLVVEQRDAADDIPSEEEACGPVVELEDDEADADEGGLMTRISQLGGVKLMYGRGKNGPEERSFSVDPDFATQLERTLTVILKRVPDEFGALKSITSAGMFVDKPNSMHAVGRACDWDVLTFADVTISPFAKDHASPDPAVRRRYWATAALCRSQSAYILHAEFNAAHQDHIHQDNGAMMPFDRNSGTTVKLVQALCNEVFDTHPKLKVDGGFGQKTADAVEAALGTLGLQGDLDGLTTWRRFLRRSGRLGYRLSV